MAGTTGPTARHDRPEDAFASSGPPNGYGHHPSLSLRERQTAAGLKTRPPNSNGNRNGSSPRLASDRAL